MRFKAVDVATLFLLLGFGLWHSGWDPEAGYSAIFLKVPAHRLTLILLANGERLWWNNPLDQALIEQSPIARSFLKLFILKKE